MADDKQKPDDAGSKKKPEAAGIAVEVRSPGKVSELIKRKWLVMGAGFLVISIAVGSLLSEDKSKRMRAPAAPSAVDTTPKGVERQSWQVQAQADLQKMETELRNVQAQNERFAVVAKQQSDALTEQEKQLKITRRELDQIKSRPAVAAPPRAPKPPEPPAGDGTVPPPRKPGEVGSGSDTTLPPPPPVPLSREQRKLGVGATKLPAKDEALVFTLADPNAKDAAIPVDRQYRKNPYAGYLPMGSFTDVVLLHGLDAGTSQYTQSNPEPVMMRIQMDATTPGAAKYRMKSCFVLGSAFGNLSTERIDVRLAKLSCVDKHNHLVLNAPLKGYLVDSDGIRGMRGKVVRRNGQQLASSILAGFASGLSGAFGSAQGTSVQDSDGGISTMLSGSNLMAQTGLGGAQSATDMLAKYYLDEAKNIFPVLTVGTSRRATLFLSEGISLNWNDYGSLYVEDVTPAK